MVMSKAVLVNSKKHLRHVLQAVALANVIDLLTYDVTNLFIVHTSIFTIATIITISVACSRLRSVGTIEEAGGRRAGSGREKERAGALPLFISAEWFPYDRNDRRDRTEFYLSDCLDKDGCDR